MLSKKDLIDLIKVSGILPKGVKLSDLQKLSIDDLSDIALKVIENGIKLIHKARKLNEVQELLGAGIGAFMKKAGANFTKKVKNSFIGRSDTYKKTFQKIANLYRKFAGSRSRPLERGEFHYGFHNYTGPGTRMDLEKVRNFPPYNNIDACSRTHDLDYGLAFAEPDMEKRALMVREADKKAIKCYLQYPDDDGFKEALAGISGKLTAEKLLSIYKGKPSLFYKGGYLPVQSPFYARPGINEF